MADSILATGGEGSASPQQLITSMPSPVGSSRPRKRRSSVTLSVDAQRLDDEKAICFGGCNPNPYRTEPSKPTADSAAAAYEYQTTYDTVSPSQHNNGNSNGEQLQRQSNSAVLHRAKSCLAFVGGERLIQGDRSDAVSDIANDLPNCSTSSCMDSSGPKHILTSEMYSADNNPRQHGPALHASERQMKRIKSEPSIFVLAHDCADSDERHDYDCSNSDGGCSSNSRSRRSSSSVGFDDMKQLDVATAERPDSAIVSIDGSLYHAQMKDGVDVPSTPAFGVPPHPESCPADMDPDTFVRRTVQAYLGYEPKILAGLSLPSPGFFPPITNDDLAAYDTDLVSAVRENRMDEIRSYHEQGRKLSCCNRFGESLIHMACRRGYAEAVAYLLEEATVSVRIRDDCGRTPLHDACWHRDTQYEIVDTIIRTDPALLFVSDKRGHTPFAYARREHWSVWRQFLFDRTDWIVAGFARKEIADLFNSVDNK